jgi:hypothetical protein
LSLQRCEGKNLESVLEEVRNRFGDTATIVEANRLRAGGVGGFFARERFEVVVDVDDDDAAPAATELPAEYGVEATEDFCERLLTMADDVSDLEQTPPISTEQPEFSAILDSITRHMDRDPAARPSPDPAPVAAAVPAPAYAGTDAPVKPRTDASGKPAIDAPGKPAIDARALARLGLPEDIRRAAATTAAPAPGADPSAWLLGLLGNLPAAPPLPQSAGSVIVVAGPREAALHLARQINAELGLDAVGLVIASPGY